MAGSYPDGPSRRMAWDTDGTVVLTEATAGDSGVPLGPWTQLTQLQKDQINSENPAGFLSNSGNQARWMCYIFPELRELEGWWGNAVGTVGSPLLQTSGDTTNGIDGTWTTRSTAAGLWVSSLSVDAYRNGITSFAVANVRAVRAKFFSSGGGSNASIRRAHIYGRITAGQTPNKIIFLNPANGDLIFTKDLDYGDRPRGSIDTRTIKVKNDSAGQTANNIQITGNDLYLGGGAWDTFSLDNITFQSTLAISSIGPGATTTVYVRQNIPDTEDLIVHAPRIRVSVGSWT